MSPLWRLGHPISSANPVTVPSSFPCRPGSPILIDGHSKAFTGEQVHYGNEKKPTQEGRYGLTIDILPDVALLDLFHFYMKAASDLPDHEEEEFDEEYEITAWYALVHVCRKWRNIVFGSPLRLDLRLFCVPRFTPVRQTVDVWPPLPIIIWDNCTLMRRDHASDYNKNWVDNIVAVLEHNDRVCTVDLFDVRCWQLEKVLAAMQQPFPALTNLSLTSSHGETAQVVPASFLGGSAPLLQLLHLDRILFPGLPNLLLSATHLVHLNLLDIPHSGYISPERMVTCLSVLTRLEKLVIKFESPQSRPNRNNRPLPPQTRTLLPVLTWLLFKGVGEYLEDLVARIDAPLLKLLDLTFFYQLILDTPQLTQFIGHTPKLETYDEARLEFSDRDVSVTLLQSFVKRLKLKISCRQSDWQLSSLAQVCTSSFPQGLIPAVEHLYITVSKSREPLWQDDIEGDQWLELLHPFTAVKDLFISREFVPRIAPTLKGLVGERATEALPALGALFLEEALSSGPAQEAIGQFVAARQLAGHPIAISRWEREDKS